MRDVLFVQDAMETLEITESVDIVDAMESTTIYSNRQQKGGK